MNNLKSEYNKWMKMFCKFAFSALTLLVGWQEGHPATEWWDAGMVMCLGQGEDLHMAKMMPLPLTCSSKSRLVLPFWCELTTVVPDKIQRAVKWLCVCVCMHACMCACMGV